MNAVTQLPEAHLEETLARFDLGQLIKYWPAPNGIENSNYFVETEKAGRTGRYVLTIMEQQANAAQAYLPMMARLDEHGLPVAPPLPNRDGESFERTADRPAYLQRRLAGQHAYNPTSKQVRAIAGFTARMHLAMQGYESEIALPDYPRDGTWLGTQAALIEHHLSYDDRQLMLDASTHTQNLLQRSDVMLLPRGMIHGDLFRDNVLFNQVSLTGVLDFHHAACGYWLYDLAVLANDWCNDGNGHLDPDRTMEMLRAYHQIRPLTTEETWFFGSFTLYAALAFWLSRLTVTISQRDVPGARFKNPDEFRRIVAQHSGHQFYFDPRQLAV